MINHISRRLFLRASGAAVTSLWLNGCGLGNILAGKPALLPAVETTAGWVKSTSNPVLGGSLGTCSDVCLLKEQGIYRMWFSWRPKNSVAYVESADGINWGEPTIVLGPDAATQWEDKVNRPIVVKHLNDYHMWYTGQARGQSWIGYATSRDGRTWTRTGSEPVLLPDQGWEKVAVMSPCVIWNDTTGQYDMWYSGGEQHEPNAIGYATSFNGYTWVKHPGNPIFRTDEQSNWERHKVAACQVIRDGEWYLMFYIGFYDEHYAYIGLARSRDGLDDWQRHPANPIIRPGPDPDSWDYDGVYKPFAIREDGRWLLWYNGRRKRTEQIGLTFHEGSDLEFDNPASKSVGPEQ